VLCVYHHTSVAEVSTRLAAKSHTACVTESFVGATFLYNVKRIVESQDATHYDVPAAQHNEQIFKHV